jgi:hypothetical protein
MSYSEEFCEKEDCGYSESKMGQGSRFRTGDGFCQTRGVLRGEERNSNK